MARPHQFDYPGSPSSFQIDPRPHVAGKPDPSSPEDDYQSPYMAMPHPAFRRTLVGEPNMTFPAHNPGWTADSLSNAHPQASYRPHDRAPTKAEASYLSRTAEDGSQWMYQDFSGSCTPTPTFDSIHSRYDPSGATSYISTPITPYSAPPFGNISMYDHARTVPMFDIEHSSVSSDALSPQLGKDWMTMAANEVDISSMPKHLQLQSPAATTMSGLKGDGVRKKNSRFEIPSERRLETIDGMISQAQDRGDEAQVKELRTQKRLLRNREAALQSRQRKKVHTERLEKEKQQYTSQVEDLEVEVDGLSRQLAGLQQERDMCEARLAEARDVIQQLQFEKEKLTEEYTVETGNLRKKIQILQETIQNAQNTPMSTVPSSGDFNDFNNDVHAMGLGVEEWDDAFDMIEDFVLDPDQLSKKPSPPAPNATAKGLGPESESSGASGILLMLLLYGAFFASNSSGGASSRHLPKVSEDLQAASTAVLDNVFKEAGVSIRMLGPSPSQSQPNRVGPIKEGRSTPTSQRGKARHKFSDLDAETPKRHDRLSHLHNSLTKPTRAQEIDQAFSITPDQYNRLTSHDVPPYPNDGAQSSEPRPPHAGRRNLATALSAMRLDNQGASAADVYTRSLLFDEIKPEVVLEFKKMVEESNRLKRQSSRDEARSRNSPASR